MVISRRGSDVSIKTLDKSPTHFHTDLTKMTVAEKFESDSDQLDCNEKCALMDNDESKSKIEDSKGRKKSLSWKNVDNFKNDDDITAVSSLLPESSNSDNRVAVFIIYKIYNYILFYVSLILHHYSILYYVYTIYMYEYLFILHF